MSSGKNKQQENYYNTNANNAVAAVQTVSPAQAAIGAKAQKWLDWDASTGPKDVTTAPGFTDALDIYGNAQNLANETQMGGGAIRLADSNSGYADQLKTLDGFNRFNSRAEGLNDAMNANRNQALGLAQQSISSSDARKMAGANLALQQENSYYNRPQKQSVWSQILGGALGMGSAYVTGGISTLGRGKAANGSIGYAPPHG